MIDLYVRDVRRALKRECYFAALSMALTFPDICGNVEFPGVGVAERYIGWFDRYIGSLPGNDSPTPDLTGELVYNLRNTFLHLGEPTVDREKIKEERNRLDRFKLILGDGTLLHTLAIYCQGRDACLRVLVVDVAYLCELLCDGALDYFQAHREAFVMGFDVIPQSALVGPESSPHPAGDWDPIGTMFMEKMSADGQSVKIQGNLTRILARETVKALKAESQAEKPTPTAKPKQDAKPAPTPTAKPKQDAKPKKDAKPAPKQESAARIDEHRLRCFFGQNFKEQKYKAKKEAIIKAVVTANNRVELNNHLTKLFQGPDVKVIHQRLKPLTSALPGK